MPPRSKAPPPGDAAAAADKPLNPDPRDPLAPYRAKRSADRTLEPIGEPVHAAASAAPTPPGVAAPAGPLLFVVQKHAARRLHFDFRLEWAGVLRSWAVPQGPSPDPAVKRLAVEVEDHPIEYAGFEGIIPKGNYGAGPVIVWDQGEWLPVEDPWQGYEKGKILFELRGYKLRGRWQLVRTKGSGKEWLLIKKPDAWAGAEGARAMTPESILSGLTLEQLRDGQSPADEVRAELQRLGAPRRRVAAADVGLMLAETRDAPFSEPGWVFELKYDGYRVLAARDNGEAQLLYRRGSDAAAAWPEVARAVKALPYEGLVLDGEMCVLDAEARPSFQRLQKRVALGRPRDVARAAVELPATYYAFDFVAFEDFDVRPLPLVERKRLLRRLLPRAGPLRWCDHVEEQGEALYAEVQRRGLEGIMAKRAEQPYRAGRSPHWLKIRVDRTADLVVAGYTRPDGARTGFGALHVAAYEAAPSGGGDVLVYCGRVGSGFSDAELDRLRARLDALRRDGPACAGVLVPRGPDHVWVEPQLVIEVRFKEWTDDGQLRHPVYLRLRDDKPPADCRRDPAAPRPPAAVPSGAAADADPEADADADADAAADADPDAAAAPAATAGSKPEPAFERKVPFSNLDKVFWPEERYTKGDLIEFYRAVSPWLLPYLRDRLVVLTRFPDGIQGKSFFQKDAPGFVPGWVRLERIWSEHAQREIDYFVADDVETLLFLVNMGTVPLHIWSSRIATLQAPDWCIIDLDPKGAPFAHVVQVALAVRALCDSIDLPSFVKTSGSTGLHVLLPLGRQVTYEQSRSLGELLSRVVADELPDIATTARVIAARGGRVYLDYLQNGHGRLLVSPYSVRPLPGAPVSTPLRWNEVDEKLDNRAFTIRTLLPRLASLADDPVLPVLDARPDLPRVLSRLGERVASKPPPKRAKR
ncbi:MAG TPA: DNA ligase D [Myxococcota bacterium]|jgi:bifunctional non-homologous end joining protein LigD|nr:DNA ligase D [Myxococcota bacterium]